MGYIDMHCDTLMQLLLHARDNMNLYDNDFTAITIEKMKQGGGLAQFFAAFMPTEEIWKWSNTEPVNDEEYLRILHDALIQNVNAHSDLIGMAYNYDDLDANRKAGKLSAFYTIEDGRPVNGKLENIKRFHDELGVRAIGLTWNGENCIGYPNSKDPQIMKSGLKDFGKDAIRYMQEVGILIDTAHLSEGGFYDVAAIANKPFIDSHANCRALSPHSRNLTDDQIRVLADKGGVCGITFCASFLNEDTESKDSTVELIVRHMEHLIQVGGIQVAAIGTDLDGTSGNLEIAGSESMPLLFDALKKHGFSEDEIEQIAHKNVERVMKEAMK